MSRQKVQTTQFVFTKLRLYLKKYKFIQKRLTNMTALVVDEKHDLTNNTFSKWILANVNNFMK